MIFVVYSCKKEVSKVDVLIDYTTSNDSCRYKKAFSLNKNSLIKNGNVGYAEITGAVDANLKKLGQGNLSITIGDSIYSNWERTTENIDIEYSNKFLEKHNSIVDILCDVEADLIGCDSTTCETLRIEKSKYRREYFDFLLKKDHIAKPSGTDNGISFQTYDKSTGIINTGGNNIITINSNK